MLSLVKVILLIAAVGNFPTTSSRQRIIGGKDATIEDFPYQVAIENEFETFVCGGSILSEKNILTAAHPFYEKQSEGEYFFLVRVGSSYLQDGGRLYAFSTENIRIHPKYGKEHEFDYDVAIITLDKPIQLGLTAATIALVQKNQQIVDGADLIVTGYGQITFDHKEPTKLQVATIPKRKSDACTDLTGKKITPRMLCAGSGMPTTFHGDSGGPLTTSTEERKLVGIVSWGKEAASETDPVVFTAIANPEINDFISEATS